VNPAFLRLVASLTLNEGAERLTTFANALECGNIALSSPTSVLQGQLRVSHGRLRLYRDVLLAATSIGELVLALRAASETAMCLSAAQPVVEVVWTYPGTSRPGLRTTGSVAREIVDNCRGSLLIVGYAVTVDPQRTSMASHTVDAIARAAERGVVVTAVLHRGVNRLAFLRAWPERVTPPSIFTWPLSDDDKATVHAKLLISDRNDGLITSANLTYHGFERNLEMGLRVTGRPAGEIHHRIQELIAAGELVPWIE
jgi:cardiolipin synthase A/B